MTRPSGVCLLCTRGRRSLVPAQNTNPETEAGNMKKKLEENTKHNKEKLWVKKRPKKKVNAQLEQVAL